ncbi:MAG: hydroxymethylbilane synthase [Saprospiraceae bacterium]|nr:hydroxymethylbilane synthase [Saprospiraceae bacterium]MBP7699097.1 hydroxymethylbilane synthase [Saprospiraceae bacterium]
MRKIRIGTRGSELALWQAHYLQAQLQAIAIESELVIIKTKGDAIQHLSFDKIEGKGFFTKEIEDALLRGEVDVAVHSMKDLPTTPPDGLVIGAVSYREDPADCLLIRREALDTSLDFKLKKNAVVGTSSARRKAQLLHFRPDVSIHDIRGNVPTRINKLRSGDFDAILLANAGLTRLQLDVSDLEVLRLSPKEFIPAPAQGVLAFQVCKDDLAMRRLVKKLHQPTVSMCTNVERKVLQLFGGGCHLPLGVFCEMDASENYHVWAAVADQWDAPLRNVQLSSSSSFELAETIVAMLKNT